eukprot:TRINITY_DN90905_c0_g1_i1.p1 TRINITY_DN90905_c0_g1~~TRINITY_DN90905_c0_g1_i1.p1  ORF type:complete len:879 (-),score=243.14 TRINITY_DN90905_c0_g1_i1:354-2990(-)
MRTAGIVGLFFLATIGIVVVYDLAKGSSKKTRSEAKSLKSYKSLRRQAGAKLLTALSNNFYAGSLAATAQEEEQESHSKEAGENSNCPGANTGRMWFDRRKDMKLGYQNIYDAPNIESLLNGFFYFMDKDKKVSDPPIESRPIKEDSSIDLWLDQKHKKHTVLFSTDYKKCESSFKRVFDLKFEPAKEEEDVVLEGADKETLEKWKSCSGTPGSANYCTFIVIPEESRSCVEPETDDKKADQLLGECKKYLQDMLQHMEQEFKQDTENATAKGEESEEPFFCNAPNVLIGAGDPNKALEELSGYNDAQCIITACGEQEAKINYNSFYACTLKASPVTSVPVLILLIAVYFVVMGIIADGYLVPVLIKLGQGMKLSNALCGATLLALGGAANDYMTGLVTALQTTAPEEGEEEDPLERKLWLGSVFGSGVFINTLCASACILLAGVDGIQLVPKVFLRDLAFRCGAVSLLLALGAVGKVNCYVSVFMMTVYILYVVMITMDAQDPPAEQAREQARTMSNFSDTQSGGQNPASARGSFRSQAVEEVAKHGAKRLSAQPGAGSALTDGAQSVSFARGRRSVAQHTFQSAAGAESMVQGADDHLFESNTERIQHHLGYEEDGGIMGIINVVVGFVFRPFFMITMATTKWDPIVNVLLPIGMCAFIPFANPLPPGNFYEDIDTNKAVSLALFYLVGIGCAAMVVQGSSARPGQYIGAMAFYVATFLTSLLWCALFANEVVAAMTSLGIAMGMDSLIMGVTLLAWGNSVDALFATIGLAKAGELLIAITGVYAGPMFNVLFGTGSNLLIISWKSGGEATFPFAKIAWVLLGGLLIILALTIAKTVSDGYRMKRPLGMMLFVSYVILLGIGLLIESVGGGEKAED